MDLKKERWKMLEGIEEEMKKLELKKDEVSDYDNRIAELEKEADSLRKELGINKPS